jgi:hypothetical protein
MTKNKQQDLAFKFEYKLKAIVSERVSKANLGLLKKLDS